MARQPAGCHTNVCWPCSFLSLCVPYHPQPTVCLLAAAGEGGGQGQATRGGRACQGGERLVLGTVSVVVILMQVHRLLHRCRANQEGEQNLRRSMSWSNSTRRPRLRTVDTTITLLCCAVAYRVAAARRPSAPRRRLPSGAPRRRRPPPGRASTPRRGSRRARTSWR